MMTSAGVAPVATSAYERGVGRWKAATRHLSRPTVIDVGFAALVLVLGLSGDLLARAEPAAPWAWAYDIALSLPLLWRRHKPFPVFLVVAAVSFVQWLDRVQVGSDPAVLVALFAVGAYAARRVTVLMSAAVAQVGVFMASYTWAPEGQHILAVVLLTGTVTAAWVMGVQLRTRRAFLDSLLERAATAERDRDQRVMLAAAAERARISREMHDIVAHSLSVMIALSDGAAASVSQPEQAQQAMERASSVGRDALAETRRLLGALRDPGEDNLAPQPGVDQIAELVEQVRAAGLAVELRVTGRPEPLLPSAQLAVYRLVQESLTNVLKHAPDATRATVTMRYSPGGVDVEVENDGRIHAVAGATEQSDGHGIAGMRERAAVFDGSVDAAPLRTGGWRVAGHLRLSTGDGRV